MRVVTPVQREEMDRRHRAARPVERVASPTPRLRNVGPVLDLGNQTFFTFRGRAYGVPPLAWRPGVKLLTLWQEAARAHDLAEPAALLSYESVIGELPAFLWRHCRPVGRVRRLLRFLGLHRNPFGSATEAELVELAALFLARRMKSSIGPSPARSSYRPTSSTTSPRSPTALTSGAARMDSP